MTTELAFLEGEELSCTLDVRDVDGFKEGFSVKAHKNHSNTEVVSASPIGRRRKGHQLEVSQAVSNGHACTSIIRTWSYEANASIREPRVGSV